MKKVDVMLPVIIELSTESFCRHCEVNTRSFPEDGCCVVCGKPREKA